MGKVNLDNLDPVRTKEEARRRGRNGGIASGKTRGALKTFKEALVAGLTEEEQKAMLNALKANAKQGNLPSLEFLLRMIGQHPDQSAVVDDDDTGLMILQDVEDTDA